MTESKPPLSAPENDDPIGDLAKLLDDANMQVTFTGWKAELEACEKKLKEAEKELHFRKAQIAVAEETEAALLAEVERLKKEEAFGARLLTGFNEAAKEYNELYALLKEAAFALDIIRCEATRMNNGGDPHPYFLYDVANSTIEKISKFPPREGGQGKEG